MSLIRRLYNIVADAVYDLLRHFAPKLFVSIYYKKVFGRSINWQNPRDLNEKINWMKLYSDWTEWTLLADKYAVRDYVENKGLGILLVPLYGHWDDAGQIEWDSLPHQFVMKTNNGSGDVHICLDKNNIDRKQWTDYFSKTMHSRYYLHLYEPHYDKIKPCIIAEQLLDKSLQDVDSSSLIDYKVWCINGNPYLFFVSLNRTAESLDIIAYDTKWLSHPEWINPTGHYHLYTEPIPRPACFDEMLIAAKTLSKGFPQMRVDFYNIAGRLYFGEITMTSAGGFMDYFSSECLGRMGEMIDLDSIRKRKKRTE